MRTAFIKCLFELAKRDKRIVLITGDLGFGVVVPFMNELPDQFVNAGVAEQNMMGLAAGMALSGKIVFVYSIANFPVLRCYEQIRNDVCYHKANVKIVAIGGGMAYGALGISHHAIEDIAAMRVLPNMLVLAPNDPLEAEYATKAIVSHDGPCYLRLGRAGEEVIHSTPLDFSLGKALIVRRGSHITLIVTGGLLGNVLRAADALADLGIQSRVLSMHTIKPIDRHAIVNAAEETQAVVTVEEHSIIGGLGSAVAEVLMEEGTPRVRFKRIGLNDTFTSQVGDQKYLREYYGLDTLGIVTTVRRLCDLNMASDAR